VTAPLNDARLSTPEAEAAYQAEYGPLPEPVVPALEPEPTPYEVWLTDDPQATWDDPDLCGPADRQRQAEPEAEAGQ
jgi:hypothetical protein